MTKKIVHLVVVIVLLTITALTLRKLTSPKLASSDSGYRTVMGTYAHIVVAAEENTIAMPAMEAAFDSLTFVDDVMSDYKDDSELSRLNRDGYPGPVAVSDKLFEVISAAVEFSRLTGGAFDITVGPVVELWRTAEKTGMKPTPEQIAAADARVGYEKLILDEQSQSISFAVEGMRLDLGAIAKGYSIDLAIDAALENGAQGILVDVGGDVRCWGVTPKGHETWNIGLRDPTKAEGLLFVLKLENMAVATSGDYERFVEIEDEKISHIIDPSTSSSAKKYTSVTIIAPTAMQADALATAVSIMEPDKAIEMIESLENVEALLIPSGEEIEYIYTEGIKKYIDTSQDYSADSSASRMTSPDQSIE